MSKSRPFSIYLLKPGYDVANTLIDEQHLTQVQAGTLPEGASLFILDSQPSDPRWKSYFGVQMVLRQASKSALLFLPINDRCFALSFGHALESLARPLHIRRSPRRRNLRRSPGKARLGYLAVR
jgi:uncharacterized protein (TIGR04141 family)